MNKKNVYVLKLVIDIKIKKSLKRVQVSNGLEKSFQETYICVDGFARNSAVAEDVERQVAVEFGARAQVTLTEFSSVQSLGVVFRLLAQWLVQPESEGHDTDAVCSASQKCLTC